MKLNFYKKSNVLKGISFCFMMLLMGKGIAAPIDLQEERRAQVLRLRSLGVEISLDINDPASGDVLQILFDLTIQAVRGEPVVGPAQIGPLNCPQCEVPGRRIRER